MASAAVAGHASTCERYDRQLTLNLIRTARGEGGEAWQERRVAALMLEFQFVSAMAQGPGEVDFVLTALGLKTAGADHVYEWVLREGFTTTTVEGFVPELLRKIQRRTRPRRDWAEISHRAAQDCKLVLARYLFTPSEVVERVVSQVDVAEGVPDEVPDARVDLPPYEAAIVNELARSARIYWVNDDTPSSINSLVEFPLGTVAMVVKAPGSDIEIELKRTGMRGRRLSVLFERGVYPVPYTHRLQGGSPGWMLHAEARNAATFRALYRAAHEQEPSMSRMASIACVNGVPTADGEADLLAYFTDASVFGDGYSQMRNQMQYCVAHTTAGGRQIPEGDLAVTVAFLRDQKPRQSIVTCTSSYRLDLLQKYLSPEGAEVYFNKGLGVTYTNDDARRFADDLLEEVLGTYVAPVVACNNYEEYLDVAMKDPRNRAAADLAYKSTMRELGAYWGTLLAAGGHTSGESFVARNLGLKSAWDEGRWRVRLIFMDHDSLFCPGPDEEDFYVQSFLHGAWLDQRYVFGSLREEDSVLGSVECLQAIYRVSKATAGEGEEAICGAMAQAYKQVRRESGPGGRLRHALSKRLTDAMVNFDEVARMLLEGDGDSWQAGARKWMLGSGYGEEVAGKFVDLIASNHVFFRMNASLYL